MLIRPTCQHCKSNGILFDSKNPVDHFCPKCGEMISASAVIQRIQDRIQKVMGK
jgi:predicted RNA-binding Zn-ribbon protein involved in translation (DUF1610 family)